MRFRLERMGHLAMGAHGAEVQGICSGIPVVGQQPAAYGKCNRAALRRLRCVLGRLEGVRTVDSEPRPDAFHVVCRVMEDWQRSPRAAC